MTAAEAREQRFDLYAFEGNTRREDFREGLLTSGVTFEMHDIDEQVAGYTIHFLAVKRTSPTLKQQLGKFPKGD